MHARCVGSGAAEEDGRCDRAAWCEGVGKTKVGEWVCELFPHNSSTLSSSEEVKADFNIHLAYSIVVIVNEAFWAGDKRRRAS